LPFGFPMIVDDSASFMKVNVNFRVLRLILEKKCNNWLNVLSVKIK
jgi:hypothetical protein